MRLPFRRAVVFENLGRVRLGESEARMRLYPSRRGLVSVLAGGVGYEKSGAEPAMDLHGVLEGSRLGQAGEGS
jgi:hypothetical protein